MLCALLVVVPASAERTNVRFQHLSLEDGLSQSTVNVTLQDRHGFMWFGTQEGLNRFDGYEFKVFNHDPDDSSSISHDFVRTIHEDSDGALWVGTDGAGFNRFDPAERRFVRFRHDPADPNSLSNDRVRVIYEDASGALWIGTDGGGINRFDRDSGLFERFRHDPNDESSLADDRVRDVIEDRSGVIWVATDGGGLNRFDRSSATFERYAHDPNDRHSLSDDRLIKLFEDRDGILWVGTYDAGVNRLDPGAGTFERLTHDPAQPNSLSAHGVRAIFQDSKGRIWVGTDAGLNEWQPDSHTFAIHRHNPTNPYSLKHDRVASIYEDRGGVLWVGTYSGLSRWNLSGGFFRHYRQDAEDATQLPNNWVSSFASAENGQVWVGTYGGGLARFDPVASRFTPISHDPLDLAGLSDDRVMSLLADSQGVLWVGTLGGGLNEIDPQSDHIRVHRNAPSDPHSISANGVTVMLEAADGTLWFGTYRAGLNRYDRASGTFRRYRHDLADPSTLSSDRVVALFQDSSGILWIGTDGGGVSALDPVSGRIEHFRHDPGDPHSLSSDHVWSLTEGPDGDLWLGTQGGGLNRWRAQDRARRNGRFVRYGKNDGLPSMVINSSVWDDAGDLWLSTNHGLSRLNTAAGVFSNYDMTHGLQSNEFNHAAGLRGRDGTLYFGGIDGFNAFRPGEIQTNTNVPRVVLTNILKFNEPVLFAQPTHEVRAIELTHRDHVIAFEFSALDFTAPDQNRYSYRLEGFDEDWVDLGNLRRASYTNLRAGEYRFRVKASNNDGVWNDVGALVAVKVRPAPWKTLWAYGVYALIAAGLLLVYARGIARKRQRTVALRRSNETLNREIHEREARERELKEEKEKAQNYLDVVQVIMVVIDLDGRVSLINQKGCEVLGYRESDILGENWLGRFVPEERVREVHGLLLGSPPQEYAEYPVRTRDGEHRTIAWHSTALHDDDGDVVGVLSSGTDVTLVRSLEAQLLHSQKMDAIGTLAGGIAHDFNNILTAIIGYTNLSLQELDGDHGDVRNKLSQVVQAGERARDLVGQILTFSRQSDEGNQPVEVEEVLEETLKLMRATLPATIEIRQTIATNCRPISSDPVKIHQVIMNLCTNAFHSMRDSGGVLSVGLEMIEVDDTEVERLHGLDPGAHVKLVVADTGMGMSSATIDRIFDPFFTTKGVGEGTGLGLSVVHGIVKSCGGEIVVESEEGVGTRFEVYLPCSTGEGIAAVGSELVVAGGSERVLVVDDDEIVADVVAALLENLGYAVSVLNDSEAALEEFRSRPGEYDLVFTDQTMPGLTGSELARELHRIDPSVRVIMASGVELAEPLGEEIDAFIQKPFQPAEIAEWVRRALDRDTAARLAL